MKFATFFAALIVVPLTVPSIIYGMGNDNGNLPKTDASHAINFDIVKQALAARQNKYHAAKLTIVEDWKQSRHMITLRDAEKNSPLDPGALAELANDRTLENKFVEYQQEIQISIDGARISYQQSGMVPKTTESLRFIKRQSASDGTVSAMLWHKVDDNSYPHGEILEQPICDAEQLFNLKPIVWTFGNLQNTLLKTQRQYHVKAASEATTISSRPCIVLESTPTDQGNRESFWMDPSKDFAIVCYTEASGEVTLNQLDCSYEQSPDGCWMPSEWTATVFGNHGSPNFVVHAKVKDYLVNPTFAADEFSITFPPGTIVVDARDRSKLSGGGGGYLVGKDGTKRTITPAESQATYEQLLRTESGQAVKYHPRQSRWLWLLVNCMLILLLTGLFYFRRLLRDTHS